MSPRPRDTSLGSGVYFKSEDYIGLRKRLVIWIVDLSVVAASIMISLFMGFFASLTIGNVEPYLTLACMIWIWLYMTAIKASPLRTLGYRAVGAKIITLRGEQPSVFRMTLRFSLWCLGLNYLLYDLLWTTFDDESQTLHDRFAGTCVVKASAKPIGTGEVHITRYTALGYNLAYEQVSHIRPKAQAAQLTT
ncbi:RDD family protein [Symmachiella macrocystis]|uniref:RDD family protein n=1 Tax=Symmachiella macrocystis TaxID=2527985 RepID=A0A5C6BB58_9PLAN|nr:RDD family protein [Symmachiella macrocystis]TWU09475.1 RDD family protein [Symmachiella macrocystis]